MKFNINAIAKSTIGVVWIVVVMTFLSEISAPFKGILVAFAGHHWTAKSLVSVIAFIVIYFLLGKTDETKNLAVHVYSALLSVVLGGLIILSFFIFESL